MFSRLLFVLVLTTTSLPFASAVCQKGGDVARFFAFGSSSTDNGFKITQDRNVDSCVAFRWPTCDSVPASLFGLNNGNFTDGNEGGGYNNAQNKSAGAATGGYNYLTKLARDSSILTYDFAVGGSTIDKGNAGGNAFDFTTQVKKFRDFFDNVEGRGCADSAPAPPVIPWKAKNTVFVIYVGNNDVVGGAVKYGYVSNGTTQFNNGVNLYSNHIQQLYKAGARRFLYISTAAHELSDRVTKPSSKEPLLNVSTYLSWRTKYDDAIGTLWNTTLPKALPGIEVVSYNTAAFMNDLWSNPTKAEYKIDTVDLDSVLGWPSGFKLPYNIAKCTGDFKRPCYWTNNFHASYFVHGLMAKQIRVLLKAKFDFGQ